MPRKTKEQKDLDELNKQKKTPATKKSTVSKKSVAKKSSTSKTATKKTSVAKTDTKKSTSAKTKASSTSKKTTKKAPTEKKTTTKKRASTTKKTTTKKKKQVAILEYYDLPYRYNQTLVKILAQTPTTLFIYWDISDKDRKKFQKDYGEDFFEKTRPILIIHNDTLGYSFEVEINDFANSWYLSVNDAKCTYRVELGRRPIVKIEKLDTDYVYVSSSNEIESPNDRVLFDQNQRIVYFRNIKTGKQTKKDMTSISTMRNMGKLYNIYDIYKLIYKDEIVEELDDLSNPSSRKSFIKI